MVPSDPVIRAAVAAVQRGDGAAFLALFTPGARLTDDGSAENVGVWVEREIVEAEGRLIIEGERDGGQTLVGQFRSHLYDLRTEWRFETDGRYITRLDVRAT